MEKDNRDKEKKEKLLEDNYDDFEKDINFMNIKEKDKKEEKIKDDDNKNPLDKINQLTVDEGTSTEKLI